MHVLIKDIDDDGDGEDVENSDDADDAHDGGNIGSDNGSNKDIIMDMEHGNTDNVIVVTSSNSINNNDNDVDDNDDVDDEPTNSVEDDESIFSGSVSTENLHVSAETKSSRNITVTSDANDDDGDDDGDDGVVSRELITETLSINSTEFFVSSGQKVQFSQVLLWALTAWLSGHRGRS